MKNDEADRLAKSLRKLASALESNPEKFEFLFGPLIPRPAKPKTLLNPFEVISKEGEVGLRDRIDRMTVKDIRGLIQEHRLDSSGLSNKWSDKKRLADLAFKGLRNRYMHGQVFNPNRPEMDNASNEDKGN